MVQSGALWSNAINDALLNLVYRRSNIDNCLYHGKTHDRECILILHVDDIVLTGNKDEKYLDEMMDEISKAYPIKKLGKAERLLGMELIQDLGGITMSQSVYAEGIVGSHKGIKINGRSAPWREENTQNKYQHLDRQNKQTHIIVLEQLLYLALWSRPDISFATSTLARNMADPSEQHMKKLIRVLQYVKSTPKMGIRYTTGPDLQINTYIDASMGNDDTKGRATTGLAAIIINKGAVYWRSHLQAVATDSANAAEYVALHEAATRTVGMTRILEELGIDHEPPTILEDDDGARRLATKGTGKNKLRHLPLKYHTITRYVQQRRGAIVRVPTKEQLVDILTKGNFGQMEFSRLRSLLGLKTGSASGRA